jgi:membrane fusion protein (multidrug efflux system)
VTPGVPVVRVVSTQNVKVMAGVPERYAGDIEEGTPVQVRLQAYSGETRTGTVTFVGSAINPQNRTFPIEIRLNNEDGSLKPEMVAKVLVTREQMEDVLVVPQSAVLREEGGAIVYVANPTDSLTVAERRSITLGSSYDGRVVVTDGVQAGAEVIILGQTNLTDGDALEITDRYTSVGHSGVPLKNEVSSAPAAP